METTNRPENRFNNKGLVIGLIIFLLASIIGNVIYINKNKVLNGERNQAILHSDSLLANKLQINKALDNTLAELNDCKNRGEELDKLAQKLAKDIEQKRQDIAKLTATKGNINAVKQQLQKVQKLNDECATQANKLQNEITDLKKSIASLDKALQTNKSENEELKKKLELAKKIKVTDIIICSLKANKQHKHTTKARKVNRVLVTFTVLENYATDQGSKNAYVIIKDAQKKIVGKTTAKFLNKDLGIESTYTATQQFNYLNKDLKLAINYDTEEKLAKGKYQLEIYIDGNLSGKKEIELK